VAKVSFVHVAEFAELGIGEEDVGVTCFGGPAKELFDFWKVLFGPEILGEIQPALQRLGVGRHQKKKGQEKLSETGLHSNKMSVPNA